MKYYAGVGSRETPAVVLHAMNGVAGMLESKGYTLRSGGAPGADTAFEKGCSARQIFLPWKGFNENPSPLYNPPEWAYTIASYYFDATPGRKTLWIDTKDSVRSLMARNVQQVLGERWDSQRSEFVLCWTKDGVETTTSLNTGGTGQAIRIAVAHNIPVINMKNADWLHKLKEIIK